MNDVKTLLKIKSQPNKTIEQSVKEDDDKQLGFRHWWAKYGRFLPFICTIFTVIALIGALMMCNIYYEWVLPPTYIACKISRRNYSHYLGMDIFLSVVFCVLLLLTL